MIIVTALKSGISRSIKSWRMLLVVWFINLLLVLTVTQPAKAHLKAAFGKSTTTEQLHEGLDIDVLGDMGPNLKSLVSSVFSGVILLAFISLLVNAFLSGGLFHATAFHSEKTGVSGFFSAAARNFLPFLVISIILSLITLIVFILLVIIPVSIVVKNSASDGWNVFSVIALSALLFALVLSLIMLVADYSRAWQVKQEVNRCFKAIAYGFSQTFRTFYLSFPLMTGMLLLQLLPLWLTYKIVVNVMPSSGTEILLLFIVSQTVLMLKLFLRVFRYGSVTALLELRTMTINIPDLNSVQNQSDADITTGKINIDTDERA